MFIIIREIAQNWYCYFKCLLSLFLFVMLLCVLNCFADYTVNSICFYWFVLRCLGKSIYEHSFCKYSRRFLAGLFILHLDC